jgi:putative hydrolase of the HAD superfamily
LCYARAFDPITFLYGGCMSDTFIEMMPRVPIALVVDGEDMFFKKGMDEFRAILQDRYGLTAMQTSNQYLHSAQMRKYKCGHLSTRNFWQMIIERWGITAKERELTDLLASCYEIDEELLDLTQRVRSENVKIGFCSNTSPDRIEGAEAKLHFKRYFDAVVLSYDADVRSVKPEPRIYVALEERLGVPRHRILFGDDKIRNVKGALDAGLQSVVFTDTPTFTEDYITFLKEFC